MSVGRPAAPRRVAATVARREGSGFVELAPPRLGLIGMTPSAEPSWQGDSSATFENAGGRRGRGPATHGSLKVVTTHLRPGYLQKNGVPYSANAVLTEYFSRAAEPNGDNWLILTAIVDDPTYLNTPFIRSTHFKRLPDTFAGWEPEPCSSR